METTNYYIADLCFLGPAFPISVEDDIWSLQNTKKSRLEMEEITLKD